MAKPKVELVNSFNEWRVTTNTLSDLIGDYALVYDPSKLDLVTTVNDLNTRKANLAGSTFTGAVQINSTLGVLNAGTFSSTLGVTGDFAVNINKFNVVALSGNTSIAGTLGVTGSGVFSSTVSSVGDFSVNTNKFNVVALSGNTSIAGTLGVTGDFAVNINKFNVVAASGNTSIAGTLGVTGTATLPTLVVSGSAAYSGTGVLLFKNGSTNIVSELSSATHANKILGANAGATGHEHKTLVSSDGTIVFVHTAGQIDIKGSGTVSSSSVIQGDLSVGNPVKFTVLGASGNTTTAGTLNVAGVTTLAATSATSISASVSMTTPVINIGTRAAQFDASLTTTAITADQVIVSLAGSLYRSVTFDIQAVDATGAKFHKVVISAIHNGTLTDSVEYGASFLGALCGTFNVDYNTGNIRLMTTPSSVNSTVFSVLVTAIKA